MPLIDIDRQNCRRVAKERAAAAVLSIARCSQRFATRNAWCDRARQQSHDVIFLGDDASHELGHMFRFNGVLGGGGGTKNLERD